MFISLLFRGKSKFFFLAFFWGLSLGFMLTLGFRRLSAGGVGTESGDDSSHLESGIDSEENKVTAKD